MLGTYLAYAEMQNSKMKSIFIVNLTSLLKKTVTGWILN